MLNRTHLLHILVFLTGAAVLIIEITATRILSPYFGNTVYSFSGIISVILLALSIGYYIGGILADKRPDYKIFYLIILLSGLTTILIQILSFFILPLLSAYLPSSTGPIITSILLFLVPGVLLGMLSPFAVKLQNIDQTDKGVGQNSGIISFYSTFGCIAGSLLTSFVFIPFIGIAEIIVSVGTILMIIGVIGLIAHKTKIKKPLITSAILLLVPSIGIPLTNDQYSPSNLYVKDGLYEQIRIVESSFNGRPARFLALDNAGSSAMYADSDELVFEYSKFYELYKHFSPNLNRALVIGGGAYSIPKAIAAENKNILVDVVEIEPQLEPLSKQYFKLTQLDQIKTHITDGRRYLRETPHKYNLIFNDAFSSLHTIPTHLATKEYVHLVYDRLEDKGLYVINIHGNLTDTRANFVYTMIKTIKTSFPQVFVFGLKNSNESQVQNIILAGYKSEEKKDITAQELEKLNSEFLNKIPQYYIEPNKEKVEKSIVLTDNYAPVDYLAKDLY